MRIVGGELSGRRFSGPKGLTTRPTAERVREALSSALEARGCIRDAVVLDLFAGTGALAFEALSRGARRASLVELDPRVAHAITRSAQELGLSERVTVITADLNKAATGWAPRIAGPVDLVFLDPPYAEIDRVEPLLSTLLSEGVLAPLAAVVVEHATKSPPTLPAGFGVAGSYRYGDTSVLLSFAPDSSEQKKSSEADPPDQSGEPE